MAVAQFVPLGGGGYGGMQAGLGSLLAATMNRGGDQGIQSYMRGQMAPQFDPANMFQAMVPLLLAREERPFREQEHADLLALQREMMTKQFSMAGDERTHQLSMLDKQLAATLESTKLGLGPQDKQLDLLRENQQLTNTLALMGMQRGIATEGRAGDVARAQADIGLGQEAQSQLTAKSQMREALATSRFGSSLEGAIEDAEALGRGTEFASHELFGRAKSLRESLDDIGSQVSRAIESKDAPAMLSATRDLGPEIARLQRRLDRLPGTVTSGAFEEFGAFITGQPYASHQKTNAEVEDAKAALGTLKQRLSQIDEQALVEALSKKAPELSSAQARFRGLLDNPPTNDADRKRLEMLIEQMMKDFGAQ